MTSIDENGVERESCLPDLDVCSIGSIPAELSDFVAIVGMGCRWPGDITNPSELWNFLAAEGSGYRDFGTDRFNIAGFYHPDSQRPGTINTRGAFLLREDPRLFDHTFFGVSPVETMTMDPTQRKMVEVAYEAFENSGEPWERFSGSNTGVFIGNFNHDHMIMQSRDTDFPPAYSTTGGSATILSNRINYLLNLRGPSMTLDTACSSSLYALHIATNAIKNGDCDSAIVGGSNLILAPDTQLLMVKLGVLSPTSTSHCFDAAADGYARGDGFGALYLKRLPDAIKGNYPIRAVIRGTSINANGRELGITHPSAAGQEAVIRHAYDVAGIGMEQTGYVECHATGTPIGDPIEISAISRFFSPGHENRRLLVGSIKSNLGHSESASGLAGIMKAILAIEQGMIPPTIGIKTLNPQIDFGSSGIQVVNRMTPWPEDRLRRASINSFGYGGANAHCIIDHVNILLPGYTSDQRPKLLSHDVSELSNGQVSMMSLDPIPRDSALTSTGQDKSLGLSPHMLGTAAWVKGSQNVKTPRLILLPFSAHDFSSLEESQMTIGSLLGKYALSDLAYTLSERRTRLSHRTFRIVENGNQASTFEHSSPKPEKCNTAQVPRLAFIFTGQGAQWQGMGLSLFEYDVFQDSIRYQDRVLKSLSLAPDWTIEDLLRGCSMRRVDDPEISQTVCTGLQIAIVDLLHSWAIDPAAVVGHSSGEIAAAYCARRITAAEAIATAYCRGKAVSKNQRQGLMVAAGLAVEACHRYLIGIEQEVQIAAVNSPESITLSGDPDRIHQLSSEFRKDGVFNRILSTGDNAYHSNHMAAIGSAYEELLSQVIEELREHAILKENSYDMTCTWTSSVAPVETLHRDLPGPEYWSLNLQSPVRFSEAIEEMLTSSPSTINTVVETGPHSALRSPLHQIFKYLDREKGLASPVYLSCMQKDTDALRSVLELCGRLWMLNASVSVMAANMREKIEEGRRHPTHCSFCLDLPHYPYTYGPPLLRESVASKGTRLRQHIRHDILGSRRAGSPHDRPSWRNILRVKDVPWLGHHRLIPRAVFPASGYLVMAVEATSQISGIHASKASIAGFHLRNVELKKTMQLKEDDSGNEIALNMQYENAESWAHFEIFSVDPDTGAWINHCSGSIKLLRRSEADKDSFAYLPKNLDPRSIDTVSWYNQFEEKGLGYGSSFRGLSVLRTDPENMIATAKVGLRTTSDMFTTPESTYLLHPASIDLCNQLALIACHGGQTERFEQAFVPVSIPEMKIWHAGDERSSYGIATAHGELRGLRGAYADIEMLSSSGAPLLTISNMRCVAYTGNELEASKVTDRLECPFSRLVWKPDISALDNMQARRIFPPLEKAETIAPLFERLDTAFACMITEIAKNNVNHDTETLSPQLKRFLSWTVRAATENSSTVSKLVGEHDVCVKHISDVSASSISNIADFKIGKRIYDNISEILEGRITGIEVAMQDNLLSELYRSGLGVQAAYPQLERLADLLAHANPRQNIIEIGAGTGAATRIIMALMAGTNTKRYRKYVYTDISSAFLAGAQSEFAGYKGVEYSVLDIEKSPLEQGFQPEYDLVIASESLHATSDIASTLRNARKLLKEGGRLLLIETTKPRLGHGLILGTISDYWIASEAHRKDSPFLDAGCWHSTLLDNGFSGLDVCLDDYPPPYTIAATILTTAVEPKNIDQLPKEPSSRDEKSCVFLVHLSQRRDLMKSITMQLQRQGVTARVLSLDDSALFEPSRVIFLLALDASTFIDTTSDEYEKIKRLIHHSSSMLWVTAGGLIAGLEPKAAVAVGLLRVLCTENPSSRFAYVDTEPSNEDNAAVAKAIVQKEARLQSTLESDREFAYSGGIVHLSRLMPCQELNSWYESRNHWGSNLEERPLKETGPIGVAFKQAGLVNSLYFQQDVESLKRLQNDWIEIEVRAIGLNWKDLAVCAGKYDLSNFSSEFSGVIRRCGVDVAGLEPGERVYGLAGGKLGNFVRTPASFCQRMQPSDDFASMATVPVAFATAVYALNHLARLKARERILIQSASGGLGIAAIQVARHTGAEIFVTVGTPEKAAFLTRTQGLPEDHILVTRNSSPIKQNKAKLDNMNFDVILSTFSGEAMFEWWRYIAPRGRFIDLGRLDAMSHHALPMEIFKRNATFSSFDLITLVTDCPQLAKQLMEEVGEMRREKIIAPIEPINAFDISSLAQALLFFSKGSHFGKIVVTYNDPHALIKMTPHVPMACFDPDAAYILVGGLGGLGRSILTWMVGRGARFLKILSRSTHVALPTQETLANLRAKDVSVELLQCDVKVHVDVKSAIAKISRERCVRGILHAAVVLKDKGFDRLSYDEWNEGIAAKVKGTINLHQASLQFALPLDFFVMTSSIQTLLSQATQAAYSAANSFQDAFARYRRRLGLPGHSIAFGVINEVEGLGLNEVTQKSLVRMQLYATGEFTFLRLLETAFVGQPAEHEIQRHDPFADCHTITCLDPYELAKRSNADKQNRSSATQPHWHTDLRFSGHLQVIEDILSNKLSSLEPLHSAVSASANDIDDLIKEGNITNAREVVIKMIVERMAELLFLPADTIDSSKSVAEYGIDSLIGVELRSWFVRLFSVEVSFLKLLDSNVNIGDLADKIVVGRGARIDLWEKIDQ